MSFFSRLVSVLVVYGLAIGGITLLVRWLFLSEPAGAKAGASGRKAPALESLLRELQAQGALDAATAARILAAAAGPLAPSRALPSRSGIPAAVEPDPSDDAAVTAAPAPRREPATDARAGDIKTLLISGSALFVLSAYLFARSYWSFIPDAVKLGLLALMTLAVYGGGRRLRETAGTKRTGESLVGVGLCLIPFNFFAAQVLFSPFSGWASAWSWGLFAMFAGSLATALETPAFSFGLLTAASAHAALYAAAEAFGLDAQARALILSAATLGAVLAALAQDGGLRGGLLAASNATAGAALLLMAGHGFWLGRPGHAATVAALILYGGAFAIQARAGLHAFAYAAGLCLFGALAVLLHEFKVPLFKYGLFFVPAGFASVWRAWSFEKSGRTRLGEPYFVLGQLALAGSLAALASGGRFYLDSAFGTMLAILLVSASCYAAMGAMYGEPGFSYASSGAGLAAVAAFSLHQQMSFSGAMLLLCAAAWALLAAGLALGRGNERQIGRPLSAMGLATLSIAAASLAARWAEPLLRGGTLSSGVPPEQLGAALLVGLLCAGGYAAAAYFRDEPFLLYPALVGATMAYVFALEKLGLRADALRMSLAAAGALSGFYALESAGWKRAGRCCAIWGQLLAGLVATWCLSLSPEAGLPAAAVCLAALAPALWLGAEDLSASALLAIYLVHRLWFLRAFPSAAGVDYALQLVFVNSAIVALRAALSLAGRPVFIAGVRAVVGCFAALSMLLSCGQPSQAAIVFAAHGVIALLVSQLLYEGRHSVVGALLLLASYEFFAKSLGLKHIEAYTVPPALFALVYGRLSGGESRRALDLVGMGLLYAPSLTLALSETWQLHGVFVGLASLGLLVWGLREGNTTMTSVSLFVLIGNALVQCRQVFYAIPRWAYLALGGLSLVGLGGLTEFRGEAAKRLKETIGGR